MEGQWGKKPPPSGWAGTWVPEGRPSISTHHENGVMRGPTQPSRGVGSDPTALSRPPGTRPPSSRREGSTERGARTPASARKRKPLSRPLDIRKPPGLASKNSCGGGRGHWPSWAPPAAGCRSPLSPGGECRPPRTPCHLSRYSRVGLGNPQGPAASWARPRAYLPPTAGGEAGKRPAPRPHTHPTG